MRIIYFILMLFCLISCFSKRDNVVKVESINKKISIGMSKDDLIVELGQPADSLLDTSSSNKKHYYMYFTDDFSDYRLYVFFDDNEKILNYRVN